MYASRATSSNQAHGYVHLGYVCLAAIQQQQSLSLEASPTMLPNLKSCSLILHYKVPKYTAGISGIGNTSVNAFDLERNLDVWLDSASAMSFDHHVSIVCLLLCQHQAICLHSQVSH
jgi:hypothetical protein